jgi:hypothetical protein
MPLANVEWLPCRRGSLTDHYRYLSLTLFGKAVLRDEVAKVRKSSDHQTQSGYLRQGQSAATLFKRVTFIPHILLCLVPHQFLRKSVKHFNYQSQWISLWMIAPFLEK